MNCPNCGNRIPAGSLYCIQCGEDIHIVPDFDPEIESNLEETLHGIVEDIQEEDSSRANPPGEQIDQRKASVHLKRKMIALGGLAVALFVAVGIVGFLYYRYNSVEVQVDQAKQSVEDEQYDRAVEYYKHALELDSDNVEIKIALSEVYFQKNNKIEYEFWLREIVKDPHTSKEQLESAYGKLIAIYRAREDYKTINELLEASNNEDILAKYQNYISQAPEFGLEEGYYTSMQPLKLSAYGTGEIYYTVNSDSPEEGELYTIPILLEEGDYTVSAYFVNEHGIASEVVTKNYHIEIESLPIPEVGAVSGDYSYPTKIELFEDTSNVYYTTDGSTPTESSRLYTQPIPMPLGKSVYKFIRIEDGRSSEVVERTYDLALETEYTPQDAEAMVVEYAKSTGKIYDDAGHFNPDTEEMYRYVYQYVTDINMAGYYYVIAEIYSDEGGVQTKTGNYYAVDVYNLKLCKLQLDEKNNYTLVEIEN